MRELRIGEKVPGVAGGTWLGAMIVPTLTEFMVLTDRDDGTLWLLTHALIEDRDYFAITDQWKARKQPVRIYGPYEGPYLPEHPELRFFVRGGRIGYEVTDLLMQTQRILSRKQMQHYTLEVFVPASYKRAGDELGCRRIDFGG